MFSPRTKLKSSLKNLLTIKKNQCQKCRECCRKLPPYCGRGKKPKLVTYENMNQNMKKIEYAVRGPLLIRAKQIEEELKAGIEKPFSHVIRANLGDSQAMGQRPVTFYRQILTMLCCPDLIRTCNFPSDAKCRAEELLNHCLGKSVGAYSDSFGIEFIRRSVADFISRRDGVEAHYENIVLSAGATPSIKGVLDILNEKIDGKKPGVMIPVPQYPLYSATLSGFDMCFISYYLDECTNWGLKIEELNRSLNEAKVKCHPRAIVVINPGNPTGQVLTKDNITEVIKFAYENQLVILADEVYQWNVYSANRKFHSFKKIINELGEPYQSMELVSFMSCSKGFMGECGIRGGYCEIVNFDKEVMASFYKSVSSSLCPTVLGQCLVDCVVKPPKPGGPSYDLFQQEKNTILNNFKKRGELIYETLNDIKGYSCNEVQGAMYAFPRIELPPKAMEEAKKKKMPADTFYTHELLENTGICVIPGSGFKQKPGTYHFRTTILPKMRELKRMLKVIKEFHRKFLEKYR